MVNLDWQRLSTTEQKKQLKELLKTQREQGFQLNKAPLMECSLIKLSNDNYKFIWNFHHILIDGWSLPIIFKEVLSLYEAEVREETCYLPTPHPYRDYIAWLNNQDQEVAIEFWRQTLQYFSTPTPLVVDTRLSPNQQQQNSDYQLLELRLSSRVSQQLEVLTQQHHVTLSTIVQAAWGLLLSRYSGEQDVVFGVVVASRPASLSGVENMVGLLINTLPLRLQISPQQQLIPWLKQIQQLILELQQYSYTPLVEIQARSELPGGIPLFESIVGFENYPVDSSLLDKGGSLQLSQIEESCEQTNYPLNIVVVPGDELLVRISYDTARFEKGAIERMAGHFRNLLSAIVENPQQAVGELPLLSEAERHQLLVEWNETATEYSRDKCIHQLFEEQVERTPDAVAVVFENQQLTYRKLNQKANQLAHHLKFLGVAPEVLVGICVERDLEMVVGLLGILKAGGAYVPLYKTGDLARYLSDGNIEFLGRIDNQVKIRGFRIELGEIEAVLTTHPQINQTVVIDQEENNSNRRLVAYVVSEENNQSDATNTLELLQIEQWQQVWQNIYTDTYSKSIKIEQPNYNTVGWKSTYTGKLIPQEQMHQWADLTVEQILRWEPKYVLEIGCGTGMLLFQIAPHCLSYCGTDISTEALDYVARQLKQLGDKYSHVSLSQKLAHDFTDIEEGRFDTVILNSVVQYFPTIDYLLEVLQSAVHTLRKGGIIFVGDVRSLPLLETFHTAINFSQASDSLTIEKFIKQVKTDIERE
ncbi:MAG: AMP-binding protein [Symploca sp. SIO1C2]|nr:AMP-binding protein [Symploca sp. SIO1C2]